MADDRSKKLLSKDSIPKIEVPKTDSAPMREFRLPSVLETGKQPTVAEPKPDDAPAAEPPAAGKKRRKRPSTGRFRDRTLDWFKTGDQLEDEEALPGDYEPEERKPPIYLLAGAAVALALVGAIVFWLAS